MTYAAAPLRVVTEPITEAVSLAELARQTNTVGDPYHEPDLLLYGRAARQYYERHTGRTMHETEYELVLHSWPPFRRLWLPRATPLIEVVSVTLTDETETPTAYADFLIDHDSEPGAIVLKRGETWPSFTKSPVSPIRIRYRAGIETASPLVEVSAEDKVPILLLAGALFENRETEVIKSNTGIESIVIHYGINAFMIGRKLEHVF